MLSAFKLGNWKSYAEAVLRLAPLTVLVGANASGKSNLIEAMQLLTWLAQGRRLSDLPAVMKSGELAIRGVPADLARDGGSIRLGCSIDAEADALVSAGLVLDLELRTDNGGARVVGEELTGPSIGSTVGYLYRIDEPAAQHGGEVSVQYNNFARGGKKPHIWCVDQQAVFTQLLTPARFESEGAQATIPVVCKRVQSALDTTLFLDPNPKEMRGWTFEDDHALRGDGRNVSSTLKRLVDEGRKVEILDFIRRLPESDITEIDFLTTQRNEVMVRLIETFGAVDQARDAGVLSDGTLRVLAIAAAVLSVPEQSLVVIEEIDNGVHPGRAQMLLEALHDAAKRRNLRVLLTTHNPALADATPLESIPDVVACYRDPATGTSKLQRLADLEDYAALVAQGPLGFLLRSGTLDRYLKQRHDHATRAAKRSALFDVLDGVEE